MNKMDLLLIDPPRNYWGFGGGEGFFAQPLGLATLAGFLKNKQIEVDIIDCNMQGIGWNQLKAEIQKRRPLAVGVSSAMTCFVPASFQCLDLVKQTDPNIHTIGGGLQFSLTPERSFEKCNSLEYIIRGDGEFTTLELLQALDKGTPKLENINGLSFRRDGKYMHNEDQEPLANLDELPFPAWHLLPMEKYRLPVVPPKWGNFALIVTSRGCPYNCKFCSPKITQKPHRVMSASRAVDMLEELNIKFDTRVFWVNDLSFNVNHERTERILDEIIERKLNIRMALDGTRTDLIVRDKNLVPKMKKAGVFMVNLGVESNSDEDLQDYNKQNKTQNSKRAVDILKKNKIHTWCFFIVGHWTHSERDLLNILEYAKWLDPTVAIFTIATPIPGTEYHDLMIKKGVIEEQDWGHYDLAHAIMPTKYLSREQLHDLYYKIYLGFYKRVKKIIKHVILGNTFARYTYKTQRGLGKLYKTKQVKKGKI